MNFVDIHSHVLPDVDDGSSSLEETVAMLGVAHANGTRQIVATPHMFLPSIASHSVPELRNFFAETVAALERLSARPRYAFLKEIRLSLGAENHISGELIEALEHGAVLPLGGSLSLLVDFSSYLPFDTLIAALNKIRTAGFVPVLAHVERYEPFMRNPERLREVRKLGCLCQLNAGSVTGPDSRKLWGFCNQVLSSDLVDAVASDAHNPKVRHPRLNDAHDRLRRAFGADRAAAWLRENPLSILQPTSADSGAGAGVAGR